MKKHLIIVMMIASLLLGGCGKTAADSERQPGGNQSDKVYLLTEEMKYDSEGSPHYKNTYTYDAEGRIVSREFTQFAYEDNDEYSYTETFSYNEKGHLISSVSTDWAGVSNFYEYTYHQNGTVASYSIKNAEQEVTGTHYLEYDSSGRFVRKYYLDQGGAEQDIFSCEYDDAGRVVKYGNRPGEASYTYDQQGRVIKCLADGIYEYQYDNGLLVVETRIPGDMKWTYGYTDGVLSSIVMESGVEMEFGEFAARKYEANEYGSIEAVRYDNGGWIEYTYEERPVSQAGQYRYFNILNEPMAVKDGYENVMDFVLPRPNLET